MAHAVVKLVVALAENWRQLLFQCKQFRMNQIYERNGQCVLQCTRAYICVCASVCFVSHILSLFTWNVFIRYDHCLVVLGFVLCSCFYFFAGRDRSSIMTSLLFFTFFCLLRTLPICYWWFGSFFSAICSRLVVTLACIYIFFIIIFVLWLNSISVLTDASICSKPYKHARIDDTTEHSTHKSKEKEKNTTHTKYANKIQNSNTIVRTGKKRKTH